MRLTGFSFLLFAGFAIFTSYNLPAVTVHEYVISVAGLKVGKLIATREIDKDITTYSLSSDASVYVLKTYQVKDDLKAVYKHNILQYATVKSSEGAHNYYASVFWNKDHYDISINGYKFQYQGSITIPIEYSVAKIYFEEPPASGQVFSEDYGVFSNIKLIKPHMDQIVFLGKADKFYYANGIMMKAEMHSSIKDFIISYKD